MRAQPGHSSLSVSPFTRCVIPSIIFISKSLFFFFFFVFFAFVKENLVRSVALPEEREKPVAARQGMLNGSQARAHRITCTLVAFASNTETNLVHLAFRWWLLFFFLSFFVGIQREREDDGLLPRSLFLTVSSSIGMFEGRYATIALDAPSPSTLALLSLLHPISLCFLIDTEEKQREREREKETRQNAILRDKRRYISTANENENGSFGTVVKDGSPEEHGVEDRQARNLFLPPKLSLSRKVEDDMPARKCIKFKRTVKKKKKKKRLTRNNCPL